MPLTRVIRFFLAFLLLLSAGAAHACSCVGPLAACSVYWNTPAIFRGTVLETTVTRPELPPIKNLDGTESRLMAPGLVRVRFSVAEGFRGAEGKSEMTVYTQEQSSACGYPFQMGKEYVVYTHAEKDGTLATSHCSLTHPVKDAATDADLVWMRGLAKAPLTSQLYGTVIGIRGQPLPPTTITLQGSNLQREITPDANGSYRLDDLPAGQYSMQLHAPPGYDGGKSIHVDLPEKGCRQQYLSLQVNTSISGRVIDGTGAPVPNMSVNLARRDPRLFKGLAVENFATTNGQGRYTFQHVPPGEYLVVANDLGPSPQTPYPTRYYPQVESPEEATPVHVDLERSAMGIDIPMPMAWTKVTLPVTVLDADGHPLEGVDIYGRPVANQYTVLPMSARTDANGAATLPLYQGQEYFVTATQSGGAQQRCGGPIRLTAHEGQAGQTIRIEHPWGNCLAQLSPNFHPPR